MQEIDKYTGVLAPVNLQAIHDDLEKKGRLDMGRDFTLATGEFATILYKEEIERAYKTSGLSGFQLLDIHDFPGQGTALVGMLDAFWDSKGFTSGEVFRKFCSPVVPLLWYDKAVFTNDEIFTADIGVSNYHGSLENVKFLYMVYTDDNEIVQKDSFQVKSITHGSVVKLGKLNLLLEKIKVPAKLNIEVKISGTSFQNNWEIWVYEADQKADEKGVYFTDSFQEAIRALKNGEKVLLSPPLNEVKGITGKFVPVFWSPVHFPNQPGTMGVLVNQKHPVFNEFPTDFHSNWQWWDVIKFSETLQIDKLDADPLVLVLDNFFKNRKLTNLFEARVGEGRLVFSSIDLQNDLDKRIASRQLKQSILSYMRSDAFNPEKTISFEELKNLNEAGESEVPDVMSIYD